MTGDVPSNLKPSTTLATGLEGTLPQLKVVAKSVLTVSGSQNFLGAARFPWLLQRTPRRYRKTVALKLLSLSPHYFSGGIDREDERNRSTREQIALDVIAPFAIGCGPGYMTRAVSRLVQHVDAVDVSDGVLACAEVLNGERNIRYLNVRSSCFRCVAEGTYDLAYSFAVAQHLTDERFARMLCDIRKRLKSGGTLLLHVVANASGWRTEKEWKEDKSLRGRLKFRYGLHCFTRTPEEIREQLMAAGFWRTTIEPLSTMTSVEDDVARQDLVTAFSP